MIRPRRVTAALVTTLVTAAACSSTPSVPAAPPSSSSAATAWSVPPPSTATGPGGTGTSPSSRPLPPPAPVTPPSPASANTADPDSTSQVVLALMYEIDTTRDTSFSDGLRRATPLLSGDYAAQAGSAPSGKPDAQWQLWTQHQAYTVAETKLSPEDRPPDTAAVAYRAYELTVKPIGRDGWTGDPDTKIALITLQHAASGWVVTQINYS